MSKGPGYFYDNKDPVEWPPKEILAAAHLLRDWMIANHAVAVCGLTLGKMWFKDDPYGNRDAGC